MTQTAGWIAARIAAKCGSSAARCRRGNMRASSAPIAASSARSAEALNERSLDHARGRALRPLGGRVDQAAEQVSTGRVALDQIFWMPLDAEIQSASVRRFK